MNFFVTFLKNFLINNNSISKGIIYLSNFTVTNSNIYLRVRSSSLIHVLLINKQLMKIPIYIIRG